MPPLKLNYLDKEAQRLEREWLDAVYRDADPERVRRSTARSSVVRPVLAPIDPEPCCVGLRAVRVMESAADFHANPQDFRCPVCRRILDAPLRCTQGVYRPVEAKK